MLMAVGSQSGTTGGWVCVLMGLFCVCVYNSQYSVSIGPSSAPKPCHDFILVINPVQRQTPHPASFTRTVQIGCDTTHVSVIHMIVKVALQH